MRHFALFEVFFSQVPPISGILRMVKYYDSYQKTSWPQYTSAILQISQEPYFFLSYKRVDVSRDTFILWQMHHDSLRVAWRNEQKTMFLVLLFIERRRPGKCFLKHSKRSTGINTTSMVYKWYIYSGIYCQLGDYMPPTTFYGNQKQPLKTDTTTRKSYCWWAIFNPAAGL